MSELVAATGLLQPKVSKHLQVLADASLVTVRPEGRQRHYRLDPTGFQAVRDWFQPFEKVWQDRFDALDALVSEDSQETADD